MKGRLLLNEEIKNLAVGDKVHLVATGYTEHDGIAIIKSDADGELETWEEESGSLYPIEDCMKERTAYGTRIKIYEYLEEIIKNERRNNIMKNAVVKFQGTSKHYHFITDLDLHEGDTVVCDTAVGITVAAVIRIEEEVSSLATKWIIDKVDIDTHKRRMELEAKKKDIKAKMEKRRKKLEDIAVFAILAKEDPDMAELLKEYQEINN